MKMTDRNWHQRKKDRNRQAFIHQKSWENILREYGEDILNSNNFRMADDFIQHGTMTVSEHCVHVAICSLILCKRLGIRCNYKDMVRGALLHDYFLYDWHDKDRVNIRKLHGFYHPGIALRNALNEYPLTDKEKDIIKKHMWPLTIIPPCCKEAWVVTTADKYCSLLETLRLRHGNGKKRGRQRMKAQYQG